MTKPMAPVTRFYTTMLSQRTSIANLQFVTAGHMPAKRHRHDQGFDIFAMGLVVDGRGDYRKDDGPVQEVRPGCLFTVHPGGTFRYGAAPGGTWDEYYFGFRGRHVQTWIERGWFWTDGRVYQFGQWTNLVHLWREMLDLLDRKGAGDIDRAILMCERIMLEALLARRMEESTQSPGPAAIDLVLEYCRMHVAEAIDFAELAERHAISYSTLRQTIRRRTGHAPAHYLTRLRCDRAADLLRSTPLPIKAIAREVGIADPYTFSRTFRRETGLSPQRYREQTRMG